MEVSGGSGDDEDESIEAGYSGGVERVHTT